jgi:hypothetical protein
MKAAVPPYGHPVAFCQAGEDADLTVLDLARTARPLALHADRRFALFQETRFVDDESGFLRAAYQAVGFRGELFHQRFVGPRRGADELLHALIVAVGDIVLDGFDVLAPLRAHHPGKVATGVMDAVHPLAGKTPGVAVGKLHEPSGRSAQGGGVIFFNAEFLRETSAVMVCASEPADGGMTNLLETPSQFI